MLYNIKKYIFLCVKNLLYAIDYLSNPMIKD